MQPKVLILDEPTAELDPKSHDDILDMICRMHEEQGMTTILVSHNMDDVARLADEVLVIDEGKLVMQGAPDEVFKEAETLESLGLALPAVTSIAKKLGERGIDVELDTFEIEEAAKAIAEALEKRDTK